MTSEQNTGPLKGIRVVEFAQNAAIPYCGRLLAGMGADVVKVEPPGGDAMRQLAQLGPDESLAYAVINPGKRSIIIDLTHDNAHEAIDALLRWADVALLAFKQSDLERYGLDWERARTVNDSLVYLVHTPFGPVGPDANEGGYDALVQGLSGIGFLMNRSDDEGTKPLPTRPAVNDFGTGMVSALGVVTALRHRDATGEGQRVDTSLLGTAMGLSTPMIARFDATDPAVITELEEDLTALRSAGASFEEQRSVYESRVVAGAGNFQLYFRHYMTADGIISVAGLSPALHKRFHAVTGLDVPASTRDLTDPGFLAVIAAAEQLFATRTTDEWLTDLRAGGYPCARYNMPYQAVDDPQVRANDYMVDLEHPDFGGYSTTGMPLQFEATPAAISGPSPTLAAHTAEVFAETDLTPDAIERLTNDGVVT